MWNEGTLKNWPSGLDNMFGEESENPLWSPISTSTSASTPISINSSEWEPNNSPDAIISSYHHHYRQEGMFFNFNEFELIPQGAQNFLLGEDFWNNVDQLRQKRNSCQHLPAFRAEFSPLLAGRNSGEIETDINNATLPFKDSHSDGSPELKLSNAVDSDDDDYEHEDKILRGGGHYELSLSSSEEDQQVRCKWIDCKSLFDNQSCLVRHIDRCHVEGRKEDFRCFWHGCSRRNRPFNARYKLLIHMRVHTGHKPNQCNVAGCGKAFSRLENLKIHLRSHTGERPYICNRCPKAFSNSSDRAKHQRTHIESKPYHCSFHTCNKKYTDPSSLRKHAKVHSLHEEDIRSQQQSLKPMGQPKRSRSSKSAKNSQSQLPIFASIKLASFQTRRLEMTDDGMEDFMEPKIEFVDESLLYDVDWMSAGELKDIDQILGL